MCEIDRELIQRSCLGIPKNKFLGMTGIRTLDLEHGLEYREIDALDRSTTAVRSALLIVCLMPICSYCYV